MSEQGLRSLRTVKPVMTPTAKLITFLLDHISMANGDLANNNPQGARAQLEYALIFANETLADNPDIIRAFYMGIVQENES